MKHEEAMVRGVPWKPAVPTRILLTIVFPYLLLAFSGTAVRAEDAEASSDEAELAALLSIVEEETDLATRTKMNSDFVPGIVTVLQGKEVEALGATNVWDALSFVPGIQIARDTEGNTTLIVRGIDFPFNSGNVKIMVNSVPLTRESSGINGSVLATPIEQVERIEVIRGPGSVVYGDFAFMGLVNIVMRQSGRSLSLRGDSNETLGVHLLWGGEQGRWKYSVNVAASDSDDPIFAVGRYGVSDQLSGIFSLSNGGFSLLAELVDNDRQATDGLQPPVGLIEKSWALAARYSKEIKPDLKLAGRARFLDNNLDRLIGTFVGDEYEVGVDLFWDRWIKQQWLASIEYSNSRIESSTFNLPAPRGSGLAPPPPPRSIPVAYDEERTVTSLTLQDQIDVSESLTLTLGARYDDNSDIGSRVTPRLSAVWRASDHHILKAQYSEGFRAPTFFEYYITPESRRAAFDFEVNKTTEINYVYRKPKQTGRLTIFQTRLEDMVFPVPQTPGPGPPPSPQWGNVAEAEAKGIELEWSQQILPTLKIDANATWLDSEETRGATGMPASDIATVATTLINVSILYSPIETFLAGLHWYRVGDRDAAPADDISYDLLDITLTKSDLFAKGLDLRVGAKNVLDELIVEIQTAPQGGIAQRYETRTYWARVSWSW